MRNCGRKPGLWLDDLFMISQNGRTKFGYILGFSHVGSSRLTCRRHSKSQEVVRVQLWLRTANSWLVLTCQEISGGQRGFQVSFLWIARTGWLWQQITLLSMALLLTAEKRTCEQSQWRTDKRNKKITLLVRALNVNFLSLLCQITISPYHFNTFPTR